MTSTPQSKETHIVILGASRGVGHYVLLKQLLNPHVRITLLLRNPDAIASDTVIKPHIVTGRVTLNQGDATKPEDLAVLFSEHVDAVLVTIGGVPHFTLSGFKLNDPTVCTRVALALMTTLHKSAKRPLPHVIAVSSMGLGQNHRHMPLALRILYPWMLSGPHADKEGMEYVLLRASSHFRTPEALPPSSILSDAERNMVPEDFLPRLTIVRPALFTDGEERGSGKLKAGEDLSTYSISRKDVALFISEQCLKEKEGVSWVNRTPVVGY